MVTGAGEKFSPRGWKIRSTMHSARRNGGEWGGRSFGPSSRSPRGEVVVAGVVGVVGWWRRLYVGAFKNKPNIYDFVPEPRNGHLEIDILEPSPGRRDASVTDTGGDF